MQLAPISVAGWLLCTMGYLPEGEGDLALVEATLTSVKLPLASLLIRQVGLPVMLPPLLPSSSSPELSPPALGMLRCLFPAHGAADWRWQQQHSCQLHVYASAR